MSGSWPNGDIAPVPAGSDIQTDFNFSFDKWPPSANLPPGVRPPGIPDWVFEIPYHYIYVRIAHAVLAASAFLLWFPVGGIIIRVWNHPQIVWIHAVFQGLGMAVFVAAAGMGIWMAKNIHEVSGSIFMTEREKWRWEGGRTSEDTSMTARRKKGIRKRLTSAPRD